MITRANVRAGAAVLAVVMCTGAVVAVHAWASTAEDADPSPPDPLTIARDAVIRSTFTGTVRVQWFDGAHTHAEDVDVDDENGLLVVGSQRRAMTDGDVGLVRESDGWVGLGTDQTTQAGPPPTENYRFTMLPDASVAGRSTRVIEAVQLHGPLRERFYLDRQTGVLLRREQTERGRTVRSVEFVDISDVRPAATTPPTPPRPRSRALPVPTTSLGSSWVAPTRIGGGFELVDAYRRTDGSLQLYYSDGLHGMSVFELHGTLSHDAFPGGGHDLTVNGRRVRVYDSAGARTFVWDAGRAVYACVTDAPPSSVGALLAKLPAHPGRGLLGGVTHFVLAPFSWQ